MHIKLPFGDVLAHSLVPSDVEKPLPIKFVSTSTKPKRKQDKLEMLTQPQRVPVSSLRRESDLSFFVQREVEEAAHDVPHFHH